MKSLITCHQTKTKLLPDFLRNQEGEIIAKFHKEASFSQHDTKIPSASVLTHTKIIRGSLMLTRLAVIFLLLSFSVNFEITRPLFVLCFCFFRHFSIIKPTFSSQLIEPSFHFMNECCPIGKLYL
jgi:hypothetical protein